jgi:DNA modification methylase
MLEINKIYNGDCLDVMQGMDDQSIDLILCDLPYNTTPCKWDCMIPFEPLWNAYKRIIKPEGELYYSHNSRSPQSLFQAILKCGSTTGFG